MNKTHYVWTLRAVGETPVIEFEGTDWQCQAIARYLQNRYENESVGISPIRED